MPPAKRNKYTEEDDRLMWKYYVSRLKQKDSSCKHPSLQFWTAFKEKYQWSRAVSGIESHFRKQLRDSIHLSGLRERYLFTAMKQLRAQLSLMDYDWLERKYNCTIHYDDEMIFKQAFRGNTELSKLSTIANDSEENFDLCENADDIFDGDNELINDSELCIASTQTVPRCQQNSTILTQRLNSISPTRPASAQLNIFSVARLRLPTNNLSLSPTNGQLKESQSKIKSTKQQHFSGRPTTRLAKAMSKSLQNSTLEKNDGTSIANRTRSSTSISASPIQQKRRSVRNLDEIVDKIRANRTESTNTSRPDLQQIKSVLVEQMKKVLNGELHADKLDDHPMLNTKNVEGFQRMLDQQKLMLSVLMSSNNQLKFFDEDYGHPRFTRYKPLPKPKPIKVELLNERVEKSLSETESKESMEDDGRYDYVFLAMSDENS